MYLSLLLCLSQSSCFFACLLACLFVSRPAWFALGPPAFFFYLFACLPANCLPIARHFARVYFSVCMIVFCPSLCSCRSLSDPSVPVVFAIVQYHFVPPSIQYEHSSPTPTLLCRFPMELRKENRSHFTHPGEVISKSTTPCHLGLY
jgi:hypothetical protein